MYQLKLQNKTPEIGGPQSSSSTIHAKYSSCQSLEMLPVLHEFAGPPEGLLKRAGSVGYKRARLKNPPRRNVESFFP